MRGLGLWGDGCLGLQADAPLFCKSGHVGPYSQLLPFGAESGGGLERMALGSQRWGLSGSRVQGAP